MNILDKTLILSPDEYRTNHKVFLTLDLLKKKTIRRILYKLDLKTENYTKYIPLHIVDNLLYVDSAIVPSVHYTAVTKQSSWHTSIPKQSLSNTRYDKQAILWFKVQGFYSQILKSK